MENILGSTKINNYIEHIEDSLYIEDSFGRQIIVGIYPNFKQEEQTAMVHALGCELYLHVSCWLGRALC